MKLKDYLYLITAIGIAPIEFTMKFSKINIMENVTLEAWYVLYKTKEVKYFFELMNSLKSDVRRHFL